MRHPNQVSRFRDVIIEEFEGIEHIVFCQLLLRPFLDREWLKGESDRCFVLNFIGKVNFCDPGFPFEEVSVSKQKIEIRKFPIKLSKGEPSGLSS
jgi:hypothetical protein